MPTFKYILFALIVGGIYFMSKHGENPLALLAIVIVSVALTILIYPFIKSVVRKEADKYKKADETDEEECEHEEKDVDNPITGNVGKPLSNSKLDNRLSNYELERYAIACNHYVEKKEYEKWYYEHFDIQIEEDVDEHPFVDIKNDNVEMREAIRHLTIVLSNYALLKKK